MHCLGVKGFAKQTPLRGAAALDTQSACTRTIAWWGEGKGWAVSDTPAPNYDLVILIGPGVIIAVAGCIIAWLKLRKTAPPKDKP